MAWLIWKEEIDCWGCEDCGFILPKPRAREAVGEYIATIRNKFDSHKCRNYPVSRFPLVAQQRAFIVHSQSSKQDEVDSIARHA